MKVYTLELAKGEWELTHIEAVYSTMSDAHDNAVLFLTNDADKVGYALISEFEVDGYKTAVQELHRGENGAVIISIDFGQCPKLDDTTH